MPYCFMPLASGRRKAGAPRGNSGCAAFLAALLLSANFFDSDLAFGAISSGLGHSAHSSASLLPAPESAVSQKEAITWLQSGSPYPGALDCLLERPQEAGNAGAIPVSVHINYPSLGNPVVDADIRDWVSDMADAFANHLDESITTYDDDSASIDDNLEALRSGRLARPDAPAQFELWGGYKITRPSPAAVSISFELWNYTGAEEGNLDILTLNYNMMTGQRLNFIDIFEKPDVALELMSKWSRKTLEPRLGGMHRRQMLQAGTEPLVENFSSLVLTPDGICINFQPWQVAPSSAGIQKVNMPLEELMPSLPMLDLWGRG